MKVVTTNISKTINKLLEEQNKNISQLANAMDNMTVENLQEKLYADKTTKYINKFTLSQLEEIAEFFNCELCMQFKYIDKDNNETIYAVQSSKDVFEEDMKVMEDYLNTNK